MWTASPFRSKVSTSENATCGRSTPSFTNRSGSGGEAPMTCPPMRSRAFSCMATNAPRRPQPASPSDCAGLPGAITTYRTGDFVRFASSSLMRSVLSAEGVPISSAPSGPTNAMTLPALVANTTTFGVISVMPNVSCALPKVANIDASTSAVSAGLLRPTYLRKIFISTLRALQRYSQIAFSFSHFLFLFHQSIHFDFVSCPKIYMPIHNQRDHKSCGHPGAIPLVVLLRSINRFAEVVGVERIEHCWPAGSVPGFGGNGPHDAVLGALRRNRRRCTGVLEFYAGTRVQLELAILHRVIAQPVVAAREIHMSVPIGDRAVSAAGHSYLLDDSVSVSVKLSHLIAVNHVNHRAFPGLEQQMTMRAGLIGQQGGSARDQIRLGVAQLRLIKGREVIPYDKRRIL